MKHGKSRYAGLLVLVAALCLLAPAAQALQVELVPSEATVAVGEALTLEVVVTEVFDGLAAAEEVLAFGFDVFLADPGRVAFTGATVAAPFDDDSAFLPETDVAGSVFPGLANTAANATLTLAILGFQALAEGTPVVGIVSDVADPNEGLVLFDAGNVDLTARIPLSITPAATPVPEPQAWLLLSVALAGLAGYGWRLRRQAG